MLDPASHENPLMLLQQTTHRMLLRYHELIGFTFVPNLLARVPRVEGDYFVRTNAAGFRSDCEFTRTKGSTPRILMFGCSMTAGDGVANGHRFSDRIAAALGVEVFNYALPGSGLDQQLLVLETFAKDVECDLIVLPIILDQINRIQSHDRLAVDRVSGRRVRVPKPFFALKGKQLELCNVPVPRERAEVRPDVPWEWAQTYGAKHQARGGRLMRALLARFIAAAKPHPVLLLPLGRMDYQRLAEFDGQEGRVFVGDPKRLPKKIRAKFSSATSPPIFLNDGHYNAEGHKVVADILKLELRRLPRSILPKGQSKAAPTPPRRSRSKQTSILGISCFYHNSAASLLRDGQIVAAAEEERFSRRKNDRRFPFSAINYCLEEGGLHPADLTAVVYYDNTGMTLERVLASYAVAGERSRDLWSSAARPWLDYKLLMPRYLRRALRYEGRLLQCVHHRAHASSAYYPSPFEDAGILTIDGVGEWSTATIGHGRGAQLSLLEETRFPHSLGLLYSAFTQFTGFRVNSGEYKMMGLAPYGEPIYARLIKENIVELRADGSVFLNMEYFDFLSKETMCSERFSDLFGGPPRSIDGLITKRERDLASSIQLVVEEAVLGMARRVHSLTKSSNLCMAGGVALNCVANGRLLREGPFKNVWIQPAAGDAGGALGAALDAYHTYFRKPRITEPDGSSKQRGSLWGPSYSEDECVAMAETHNVRYEVLDSQGAAARVAAELARGNVVGHFSDRMEFGPRALGSRSILADPRNEMTQVVLNQKIKYRESFRPFAPAVLRDQVEAYFELSSSSPYMLLTANVQAGRRKPFQMDASEDDLLKLVQIPRSDIPAVTHVDFSARIQTVGEREHPAFYEVLKAFDQATGCAVLVNTSFNVRGEPIVCTPFDAFRCFMRTEMDVLLLNHLLVRKDEQIPWPGIGGATEVSGGGAAPRDPDDLAHRLLQLFDAHLLRRVRKEKGFEAGWFRINRAQNSRTLFEFSGWSGATKPAPGRVCAALMRNWAQRHREMFRPLLAELCALATAREKLWITSDPATGDVSSFIYEMF